jgi:hypothetical protein
LGLDLRERSVTDPSALGRTSRFPARSGAPVVQSFGDQEVIIWAPSVVVPMVSRP